MATASSTTTTVPPQRQPRFVHLETRLVELMTELFQLNETEGLDFGLYRIIRRHNREAHAFLGEILVDKQARALRGGRLAEPLAQHPADRVYANDPASLSFEGCGRFEAVEAVFALQFGRN